ncbi:hypothetical protein [Chitinilyticum litopenaei]|uniref:hypothetical protein n=1 Tax=Chitinilyticum litopenaei TaxID=1121276 RepID=UPI001186E957|nr:hypothetical protein [Chitinilyticum litopenaei]
MILDRVALDECDAATVRQLYGEAQNWARHYEQLVVNANVLIVSACLIFVGLAFGEKISTAQSLMIIAIPVFMGIVGIVMTNTLFNLYAKCIERMIRFENFLGCFSEGRWQRIDGGGALLSPDLMALPVNKPTSVRFFLGMHGVLIASYVLLVGVKLSG